jgi:hypothetical protein
MVYQDREAFSDDITEHSGSQSSLFALKKNSQ